MLSQEILDKITEIFKLLSQVNNYWTKLEFTKPEKKYIGFRLTIQVYTFIKEIGREEERLAYLIKKKIDLNEVTAEIELKNIIKEIKELISDTNEND